MIGCGSVVTKNIPDYGLAWGNPAQLHGFVCPCGSRLEKVSQDGENVVAKCPACGQIVTFLPRNGANKMINIARPQLGEEEKKQSWKCWIPA